MILPTIALASALTAVMPSDGLVCFDTSGRSSWVSYSEWLGLDMRGIIFCTVSRE